MRTGQTHPHPLRLELWPDADGAGGVRVALSPNGAVPRQVVLLGAGMDSRAWRLDLPAGGAAATVATLPTTVPESMRRLHGQQNWDMAAASAAGK
jgi:Leucine carboxyl methyltransferase